MTATPAELGESAIAWLSAVLGDPARRDDVTITRSAHTGAGGAAAGVTYEVEVDGWLAVLSHTQHPALHAYVGRSYGSTINLTYADRHTLDVTPASGAADVVAHTEAVGDNNPALVKLFGEVVTAHGKRGTPDRARFEATVKPFVDRGVD